MPDAADDPLGFLGTVGLVLGYRCNASCAHCVLRAGPDRREAMAPADLLAWIEQLAEYRGHHVRALALTGGEPFSMPDLLAVAERRATELGFLVTAVTNAFWARTAREASAALRRHPGLLGLGFSTDAYHLPFVPLDHVRHAAAAAEELGRAWEIEVCTESLDDPAFRRLVDELRTFAPPERIRVVPTFAAGRALEARAPGARRTAPAPPCSACDVAGTPMIFPDGRVMACIGPVIDVPGAHPLCLGDLRQRTVPELLDRAELDPVLHAIRVWGPHRIVSELRTRGGGRLLPASWHELSPCDACHQLVQRPALRPLLRALAEDAAFSEEVAWGRLHYLGESTMLVRMRPGGRGAPAGPPRTAPDAPAPRA